MVIDGRRPRGYWTMHYLVSFFTSLGTIVFIGVFTVVCLAAVAYFHWIGFFGTILIVGGPGIGILYRREHRRHGRSESMELEDKIGYDRMSSGVDYFEKIWKRGRKDHEE